MVEHGQVGAHLKLSQVAFCDGSVRTRLEPGEYDLQITTLADGSARAVFFHGGDKKCETRAVSTPGTKEILIGLLLPAVQKELPAVQKTLPAVQQTLPAVQRNPAAGGAPMGSQGSK